MSILQRIALTLTIIGAINWGLIGFLNFDLVAAIFGGQTAFLSRVVYALVGLAGLFCLTLLFDPVKEDRKEDTRQRYTKPNYGTEFGEETDLTSINTNTDDPNSRENQ